MKVGRKLFNLETISTWETDNRIKTIDKFVEISIY